MVARFEVYLVDFEPAVGSEIRKTRPAVVVSPDEMNRGLRTVLVAPLTSSGKPYPCRVACRFQGKDGLVALDQLRAMDRSRLLRKVGDLDPDTSGQVLAVLRDMFT